MTRHFSLYLSHQMTLCIVPNTSHKIPLSSLCLSYDTSLFSLCLSYDTSLSSLCLSYDTSLSSLCLSYDTSPNTCVRYIYYSPPPISCIGNPKNPTPSPSIPKSIPQSSTSTRNLSFCDITTFAFLLHHPQHS